MRSFFSFRSVFLATGKGRCPKLPSVELTRCGTVIQTVARHLFALDMCFVVSVNWLIAEHSVVVVWSCLSFTGLFDLC